MGPLDEEQAVFEQLTLSNFKKWKSTALSRCTLKSENIFGNWKPFKNTEKPYLTLLVLTRFRFLSWIFGHVEKRLD